MLLPSVCSKLWHGYQILNVKRQRTTNIFRSSTESPSSGSTILPKAYQNCWVRLQNLIPSKESINMYSIFHSFSSWYGCCPTCPRWQEVVEVKPVDPHRWYIYMGVGEGVGDHLLTTPWIWENLPKEITVISCKNGDSLHVLTIKSHTSNFMVDWQFINKFIF